MPPHPPTRFELEPPEEPRRPGVPLEVRRIGSALRARRARAIVVVLLAASVGILTGKFLVPKTFVATSKILWVPHTPAATSPAQQAGTAAALGAESAVPTFTASVMMDSTMLRAMDRLGKLDVPVASFAGSIKVAPAAEDATLLAISATERSSDGAATVANTVAEVFIEQRRDIMRRHFVEVSDALGRALIERRAAVDASRERYDRFRDENHIQALPIQEEAAIKELARLEMMAHDVQVELGGTKATEHSLGTSQSANPETVVTSASENRVDAERLSALETELAQARARYTDDHPAVRSLTEQVASLRKAVAERSGRFTSQTVGRSAVHDAIASQLAQAHASAKSFDERKAVLVRIRAEADARAHTLTEAEAESARLLSAVQVNEEDVVSLLRQIAASEEDVRGVTSDFQLVSRAVAPSHPIYPVGVVAALIVPLIIVLSVLWRWVSPRVVKTASELAFWTKMPVLWSARWPYGPADDAEVLAREVAYAIEARRGVVGVAAMRDARQTYGLVEMVAERLRVRGVSCGVFSPPVPEPGATLAHTIERSEIGQQLSALCEEHGLVLFVLPVVEERAAIRAARCWIDALVVVVPSGEHTTWELSHLRQTLGLVEGRGAALALVGVEDDLLSANGRTVGTDGAFWAPRPLTAEHVRVVGRLGPGSRGPMDRG